MGEEEVVMLGSLIGLSAIDLRARKIPVVPVLVLGLFFLIYRFWGGASVLEVAAGMIPGMVLLFLAFVTKESVGYGDGLVLLVLGLCCGIAKVIAIFGMALLLSAVLAALLLLLRKAGRKTELPFLPCLCSGYLLYLLW